MTTFKSFRMRLEALLEQLDLARERLVRRAGRVAVLEVLLEIMELLLTLLERRLLYRELMRERLDLLLLRQQRLLQRLVLRLGCLCAVYRGVRFCAQGGEFLWIDRGRDQRAVRCAVVVRLTSRILSMCSRWYLARR